MSATILDRIADDTRTALAQRKQRISEDELRARVGRFPLPGAFAELLRGPGTHIIAEIKYASPSSGLYFQGKPVPCAIDVAADYLRAGALALSVLTEQKYFDGSPGTLSAIRREFPSAPLLMKDFVLEEYQLHEARVLGADAVLLIVALLGSVRTASLLKTARALGLTSLVEVHDEEELRVALGSGATLIGVNNRNLKTLEVTLETSLCLADRAPKGTLLISESGIRTGAEIKALKAAGFSGFLIGTAFMRSGNPGAALARILAEIGGAK